MAVSVRSAALLFLEQLCYREGGGYTNMTRNSMGSIERRVVTLYVKGVEGSEVSVVEITDANNRYTRPCSNRDTLCLLIEMLLTTTTLVVVMTVQCSEMLERAARPCRYEMFVTE